MLNKKGVEVTVVYFMALFQYYPEESEKNKKNSVRITGLQ
jgi:hypothetical protein